MGPPQQNEPSSPSGLSRQGRNIDTKIHDNVFHDLSIPSEVPLSTEARVNAEKEASTLLKLPSVRHWVVSRPEKKIERPARVRYLSLQPTCGGWLRTPVLHPDHSGLQTWKLLGMIAVIYLSLAIPILVAFDVSSQLMQKSWYFVFSCIVDLYFILDLLIEFMTAFRDEDNNLVKDPGRIARRYVSGWLVVDLISAVPWDLVSFFSTTTNSSVDLMRTLRLGRLLRLAGLLKANKLSETVDIWMDAHPSMLFTYGLLRITVLLFLVTHWGACAWFFIGENAAGEGGWVDKHIAANASWGEKYTYSLYFTLTTMTTVGYGDITPSTYTETCFALGLLVVASLVFAALMGSLTELLYTFNLERKMLAEKKRALGQYMRWRRLPNWLNQGIRQHLVLLWEAHREYQAYEGEVKSQLSPALRRELSYHVYGSLLMKAPFLAWMRNFEVCIKELSCMVTTTFLSEGDHVFRRGDPNEQIFMLIHGSTRVTLNESIFVSSDLGGEKDSPRRSTFSADFNANRWSMLGRSISGGHKPTLRKSLSSWFQNSALKHAEALLMKRDAESECAARCVQARWRRSYYILMKAIKQRNSKDSKQAGAHGLRTASIEAPAYFGEACLWVPFKEWDVGEPPTYEYTVVCTTKVEILIIPRPVLKQIVDRFSPWLENRLDSFRQDLLDYYQSKTQRRATLEAQPKVEIKETKERSAASSEPAAVGGRGLQRSYKEPQSGSTLTVPLLR